MSGASSSDYVAMGNMAVQAYGAYEGQKEKNKVAKAAAQPRVTEQYRAPYMNEYISKIAPYIMQAAQSTYQNRMKGYGAKADDFGPIAEMLSGISTSYSGVGSPGNPITSSYGNGAQNIFSEYGKEVPGGMTASTMPQYGGDSVSPEWRAEINARKAAAAENRAAGLGVFGGTGVAAGRGVKHASDSQWDGMQQMPGGSSGSLSLFDAMFEQNYNARNPDRGVAVGSSGGGADWVRNAAWGYAGLDNNPFGQGDFAGELKQGAVRQGVGTAANLVAPGVGGLATGLAGGMIDRNTTNYDWMWNYNQPEGSWLDNYITNNLDYNVYGGGNVFGQNAPSGDSYFGGQW